MNPFETYQLYLSLRNHFTKDSYDYFKFKGKVSATINSFYKRKDRYFFEMMSRKYGDKELKHYFLANFATMDEISYAIAEMKLKGELNYKAWEHTRQSLFYKFKQESHTMMEQYDYEEFFDASKGHPPILKEHLAGNISLENMVIYDYCFDYVKDYDKLLDDPVWKLVGRKIKKYKPFLNINKSKYKDHLIQQVQENYV